MKQEALLKTEKCYREESERRQMSGQEGRPSLGELVQRFGLEVPYTRRRDLEVPYSRHRNLPPSNMERAGGQVEERSRLAASCLYRERLEEQETSASRKTEPLHRLASLSCRLGAKLGELVRAVETLRPVAVLKAALNSVTFQQELGWLGPPVMGLAREQEEQLSLEHRARLEDVFLLHDRGGRGFLTKGDLLGCLRMLGHNRVYRAGSSCSWLKPKSWIWAGLAWYKIQAWLCFGSNRFVITELSSC